MAFVFNRHHSISLLPFFPAACLLNVTKTVNKSWQVDSLWKMAFNLLFSISVTLNFPSTAAQCVVYHRTRLNGDACAEYRYTSLYPCLLWLDKYERGHKRLVTLQIGSHKPQCRNEDGCWWILSSGRLLMPNDLPLVWTVRWNWVPVTINLGVWSLGQQRQSPSSQRRNEQAL